MEVLGLADSPCRPRSARYAEKGYPNYAEAEPDLCAPASPCRARSARYAEMGYPDNAEADVCAVSAPSSPRSARHAKDGHLGLRRHKRNEGSVAVKNPVARDGRKRRGRPKATATAVDMVVPLLQGEEAVAQDGRKRRRTVAAPVATAMTTGNVLPLPKDNEEVAPVDGGADEHEGAGDSGKSWRLRVKETLRAFSSNYLHFVQEEQQRSQAVRQELDEAARAQKRQDLHPNVIGTSNGILSK